MSYRQLLTDRCSLYHLKEAPPETKYGVEMPAKLVYPEMPDKEDVPCLFVRKGARYLERGPDTIVIEEYLVHFLPNEDVRTNDRVVWNGVSFILRSPRNVRGHHIEAIAYREASL